MKRYLECGKIVSTHGIKGELKVQHWCDNPEYLCGFSCLYLRDGAERLEVERARAHKGMVILKLSGIDDPDSAAAMRGKILFIDRKDDPDGEGVFLQDMLGIEVRNADTGRIYGKLTDIIKTGANDVYEITGEDGKKRLIPAIPDVIADMDIEAGLLIIKPLKGLFDDED